MASPKSVLARLVVASAVVAALPLYPLLRPGKPEPAQSQHTTRVQLAAPSSTNSFYVSPNGTPSADGSLAEPWDLDTALNQPSAVHPGDTIWMRGGVYVGVFRSRLNGAPGSPITLRQYPGERATIDEGGDGEFDIFSTNAVYWGFEVTNSDTSRPNVAFSRVPGITATTPNNKFINLLVHDTGQGFGFWVGASDSEISGCLIYYNGNHTLDHGIYTQNQNGTKRIADNILFNNYGHGLHIYGSDLAYLDNYIVDGNTSFNNGLLSTGTAQRNLLLGGGRVARNPVVTNNYLYYPAGGPTSAFDLGYRAGCVNATVTGNYLANNSLFVNCLPVSMTGNSAYGSISGFSESVYPNNTYYSSRPAGTQIFVRPNPYEAGRANITVFNWDLKNKVEVDLRSLLTPGSTFEIRNAADFFGTPVVAETYTGDTIAIPMTGLSVAAPVGFPRPPSTSPEFGAFVLLTTRFGRETPRLIEPRSLPKTRDRGASGPGSH